jgi:aryl-alcohol dehydrogenase-like predicted oxidoreductase
MRYRPLGNTGLSVSEVAFGTWAIGGSWGPVDEKSALDGLARAMDAGVNFFDTADVYGDGRAERLLAKATRGRPDILIATKFGRGADHRDPETYREAAVRRFCEASLRRLEREAIDLYQIHCPPHEILQQGDVFQVLDKLQREGKIRFYGVSVESRGTGAAGHLQRVSPATPRGTSSPCRPARRGHLGAATLGQRPVDGEVSQDGYVSTRRSPQL